MRQPHNLAQNNVLIIKEKFQLVKNLQSARCLPFVISKVLAARMRKLITARARKCSQRPLDTPPLL